MSGIHMLFLLAVSGPLCFPLSSHCILILVYLCIQTTCFCVFIVMQDNIFKNVDLILTKRTECDYFAIDFNFLSVIVCVPKIICRLIHINHLRYVVFFKWVMDISVMVWILVFICHFVCDFLSLPLSTTSIYITVLELEFLTPNMTKCCCMWLFCVCVLYICLCLSLCVCGHG